MYSLQKIKKYWLVNEWIISLLYALIFSLWILNISSFPVTTKVLLLLINVFLIKGLILFSKRVIEKVYRPNYYNQGKMTLVDVVKRQTTSGGMWSKVYEDEDDYNKRKKFDIGIRSIWLAYLLTIILLFVLNSFLIIKSGRNIYFSVNWNRVVSAFFLITAYSIFLVFVEGFEFEKARFGKANIKRLIRDYIPLIIIILATSLLFAIK